MGRKKLKRFSTYCTKCHEINMRHLDIQKHVSCEKWFKYYIFFGYRFRQKFLSDVELTGLKVLCMGVSVHLQRHTKVLQSFRPIGRGGGEVFKIYCNIFILQ